jgi:hypothetical protein
MNAPRALLLLALAPLAACGSGGDGGGGGSTAVLADVVIGDAPVDDLLSFSAQIESVRLHRDDGTFTPNIGGTLRVEFLGLNGAFAFLAKDFVPTGTYDGIEITYTAGEYQAKADDGSDVTVVPTTNVLLIALTTPVTAGASQYLRFTVDLDLSNSLSGTVSSGSVDFDPLGSCGTNDGSVDAPLDELRGTVVFKDLAAFTVLVDGFVGDPPLAIGRVTINVPETGVVLLDDDNLPLTRDQFFAAIVDGTLLEVDGSLGLGGALDATQITIEDAASLGAVRIAGVILSLGTGTFDLRVAEIKDGADVAQPVIDDLPDPTQITVAHDGSTVFLFDGGGLTDASALAVGKEVQVRFSDFMASPFPAGEIEIDATPGFEATLIGQSQITSDWIVRFDPEDPAIASGAVSGPNTNVRVELSEATLELALDGAPPLVASELPLGLELELHGDIQGPSDAPVLAAKLVRVRPGLLRGADLLHVAAGGGNLVVDGGSFVDPFGAGVTPGPLQVWLEPGCRFEGAATSAEEFQDLFGGQALPRATVDVFGLGNGLPNEVRAYAIRVQAR